MDQHPGFSFKFKEALRIIVNQPPPILVDIGCSFTHQPISNLFNGTPPDLRTALDAGSGTAPIRHSRAAHVCKKS